MRTQRSLEMLEVDVTTRTVVHVHQFNQLRCVHISYLKRLALSALHSHVYIVTIDDTCIKLSH